MKEFMVALQSGKDAAHGQKIPFYEQIYHAIKRDIEDGNISCGEKLPSTRLLATNLNVSRFTVDLAYDQLVAEGYIQARAGSGFFVCDLSDLFSAAPGEMHDSQPDPVSVKKPKAEPIRVDFSPFAVDAAHFPYNNWKKRSREVLDETEDLLVAREAAGDLRLRQTIATYLYRSRGVHCSPEQILIGAGNEYLLLLCMQLLGSGCSVVMENPTYKQAYEVLRHTGCQVRAGISDANGLLRSALDKQSADVAYVMPSHQFPMGTVMPLGRRQELLDWAAAEEGRYLIEDDHDSEFRYIGKPIPSLQSRDMHDCVIYLGTFSKSISPALRMSYMVLPRHLTERFYGKFGFYTSTVSTQQQLTVWRFMESGDFERHLNRMRRIYKAKQDFLLKELKRRSWVHSIRGENAGLHLVVEVACAYGEAELLAVAEANGVQLYGMNSYRIEGAGNTDLPTLLFGFGGLTESKMIEGLQILDGLFHEGGTGNG